MSDAAHQKSPQGYAAHVISPSSIEYLQFTVPMPWQRTSDGAPDRGAAIDPSLQAFIDAMPAQVAVIDASMNIVAVNSAWPKRRMAGASARPVLGRSYVEVCAGADPAGRDARFIRRGLRRLQSGAIRQFTHAHSIVDGRACRHFVVHVAPFQSRDNLLLASYTDVTDNRERIEERRQYSLSLLLAEEEERKRIARELHDETAQQLALMRFGLMALTSSGSGSDVEAACARIEEALGAVQQQLRTLSYVLHPPELAAIGIEAALRNFVQGFGRRAGIIARFESEARELRLSRDVEVAFYRVAQEALVNVQKHSQASRVDVRLKWQTGDLILEIEDNGIGISDDVLRTRSSGALGVGLVGMRERLEALSGRLEISRLPLGTIVTARVPRRRIGDI